jgi:hypothetical protein
LSRAKPFTKAEVRARKDRARVRANLLDKALRDAPVPKGHQMAFKSEVCDAVYGYRVRMLAHKQELPGRNAAALTRCVSPAQKLLVRLNSLPESLRIELRAGGLEH